MTLSRSMRRGESALRIALCSLLLLTPYASMSAREMPEAQALEGPMLTLDGYLQEVELKHEGFKSAKEGSQAANMYVKDAGQALMPTLYASVTHIEDRTPQPPFSFSYDRLETDQFTVGLSQQTDFGLQGKLHYDWTDTSYYGIKSFPGIVLPFSDVPTYYSGHPQLELTFSLWRNWLGAESREQVETNEAQANLDLKTNDYQAQQIRYLAESTYWRLALAREAVKVARDASDRSEKIDAWTRRRANLELADRSDYLQSQASVKSHRLDLRLREDDERSAAIAFNSARGKDGLTVAERLAPFSAGALSALKAPVRHSERGDVAVARENARLARISAELARQKDLPTLEVFGAYAYNGQAYVSGDAFNQSIETDRPTQSIGLRLNAPLDVGSLSAARKGHEMQKTAADLLFHRKSFEQDRDWDDLAQKFIEAQERLKLYEDLESVQREKFANERERQQRGRTTMQQVLLFEIDYETAQLGRIGVLNELNQLNAQMKLFGVTYESSPAVN